MELIVILTLLATIPGAFVSLKSLFSSETKVERPSEKNNVQIQIKETPEPAFRKLKIKDSDDGHSFSFPKPPVFFLGSLAICGISLLGFSNECVRVLEPIDPEYVHNWPPDPLPLNKESQERREAYMETYKKSKTEEIYGSYGDTTSLETLCAGHILTHKNHRGELSILVIILAAGSIAAYQSKDSKFTVILKK